MGMRSTEFSVAEAKARFSELLERAAGGEEIVIRRHGTPIAKLVKTNTDMTVEDRRKRHEDYIAWRREHGPTLGPGQTVKDLIDEGRRY